MTLGPMISTSAARSEHRGPIRPPGDHSASRARSAASDQALNQMKNELAPLRLSPEVRSHSPSTSTQLQQGGSPSPVVCERKVSESDFRDVHRGELLCPGRRASDDSGLRMLGPANSSNSPSLCRPSPACSSASSPESIRVRNGSPLAPNPGLTNLSPLSPRLSPSHRRRHSISSAAAIVRYVEWTPEDSDSRRRGRLVVESERNVDFASRQADTYIRRHRSQITDIVTDRPPAGWLHTPPRTTLYATRLRPALAAGGAAADAR